jgi:DNA/RNA-binding domain of Phe-tRNA-synthetase-like protein
MGYKDITFSVSDEARALGLKGVYFAMGDLRNQETDPAFEILKENVLRRVLDDLRVEGINDDRVLQGFRDLHTKIGFSNRNFVSAPENLLVNLLKNGRFPHVNLLVDIYNLISIETRLSLGAHDIAHVQGNIQLRITSGKEGFLPLGTTQPKAVRPGGYAYIDDANDVLCMLEVRQVEKTKATLDTTESFYIVQGNSETSLADIQATAQRLIALTKRFCGGTERLLAEF